MEETFFFNIAGCKEKSDICALISEFFREKGINTHDITSIGISNVVPGLNKCIEDVCIRCFNKKPVFISHHFDCGITYDIDDPAELGPDLIAAAVAGYNKYHEPLIIVDMGTATTFSIITKEGIFKGVIICPGLKISAESFTRRIPYLPEVKLELPSRIIGRNTVESVQSGLVFGHICLIEGILRRLALELKIPHKVIVCGGLSFLVKNALTNVDAVEPYLVLEGVRIMCEAKQ